MSKKPHKKHRGRGRPEHVGSPHIVHEPPIHHGKGAPPMAIPKGGPPGLPPEEPDADDHMGVGGPVLPPGFPG